MDFILSLALATCAKAPDTCSFEELDQGLTLVTVCDLAPEKNGEPAEFMAKLPDGIHYFTLVPSCEDV